MRISLNLIGYLYIIIVGGVCHIFPIPEIVKAFLALPGFLVIPYLVGVSTSVPVKKFLNIVIDFDILSKFIIHWSIGVVSMVVIAYFLNYFWLFDAKIYVILIFMLMILAIFNRVKHENLNKFIILYGGYITISLSILIGVIVFLFITYFSPYPYEEGGDSIWHNYMSMQIIENNFFFFQIPYLSSLSILASILIQIFDIQKDPYTLWWSARFILYLTYSFGLYLFSYQLSKNRTLALITSIIGVLVVHHNSGMIYLNDLSPKAIILITFPYFLFVIHKEIIQKKILDNFKLKNLIYLFLFVLTSTFLLFFILYFVYNPQSSISLFDNIGIILITYLILTLILIKYLFKNSTYQRILFLLFSMSFMLMLIHTTLGFVSFVFILSYLTILILLKKQPLITNIIVCLSISFAILFFLLQLMGFLIFDGMLFNIYNLKNPKFDDFENVFRVITEIYSPTILHLFIMGCTFSIFYNREKYFPLLFLISIICVLMFAPFSAMFRMIIFLNPILAYLAAYGMVMICRVFFTRITFVPSIYILMIIIILLSSTVGNCMNEINKVTSKWGVFSYAIHEDIFLAADALKNKTPPNTIVIMGDERNWGIKTIVAHSDRHYVYVTDETPRKEHFKSIYTTKNAKDSYEKINEILCEGFECSLCGLPQYQCEQRYDRCKQQVEQIKTENTSIVIMWSKYVRLYPSHDKINKFYNTEYFTPLYENREHQIYIFGVNPEPGVPFKIQNVSK